MNHLLFLTHLGVTLALVGLIWTVQVVQYPLFDQVGEAAFADYHRGHSARITVVVGPLMLIELVTGFALLASRPAQVPAWAAWAGLALIAVIWLSTAVLQVPRHNVLAGGFDPAAHRLLVLSNWLRTFAWSARGALLLWLASRSMPET